MGLLLKLLEGNPNVFQKMMKRQAFAVSREEKGFIVQKMEEYIEKDLQYFREAGDLERKLMMAMSLHDKFNDPGNSDVVEIKFE